MVTPHSGNASWRSKNMEYSFELERRATSIWRSRSVIAWREFLFLLEPKSDISIIYVYTAKAMFICVEFGCIVIRAAAECTNL